MDKDGYIYFVASPDWKEIKIGFTTQTMRQRLANLKTAHSKDLHLLTYCKGTKAEERQIHERFANKRVRREWFAYDDELEEFVYDIIEAVDVIAHDQPRDIDWTLENCMIFCFRRPTAVADWYQDKDTPPGLVIPNDDRPYKRTPSAS